MADIKDNDVRKKWAETYGDYMERPTAIHDLQPADHFKTDQMGQPLKGANNFANNLGDMYLDKNGQRQYNYLVHDKGEHFIRDLNDTLMQDPKARERAVVVPNSNILPETIVDGDVSDAQKIVFSGATTNVNPTNDPDKAKIITFGLSETEEDRFKEAGDYKPPLSVLYPFTRMIDVQHRNEHQLTNLTSFNRYHLPISDLEHRKAFRHVFFTRPECYVCCLEDGRVRLSQQAEYDEDFNTSYSRMPYISKLLSPVYVSGTFGRSGIPKDNFNYLLSNRCLGLTPSGATLSTQDSVTKSIQGYTVTPGMHYEGRQGATIQISFRDTKYLEVYEYIRMWMLYIWKIKYGSFAPSFNGYKYINKFPEMEGKSLKVSAFPHLHPLDRALEYTCSMFDFINDESDTFPRYWCKYFGMYPVDINIEGLGNSNNDALKEEMTISVTFKYAYKIENTMKSLVEFNYNAGICNKMGQPTTAGSGVLKVSEQFAYANSPDSKFLKQYVGPGAPFVGTPYVVLMAIQKDIMKDTSTGTTMTPCLRFSPLSGNEALSERINMGLESITSNNNIPVTSNLSDVKSDEDTIQSTQSTTEPGISEDGKMSIAGAFKYWEYNTGEMMEKFDEKFDAADDLLTGEETIGSAVVRKLGGGGTFSDEYSKLINLVTFTE